MRPRRAISPIAATATTVLLMRSKAHLGVDSRTKLIQPVIVVQTLTDSAVTIAASYAAKAYGIKTGALVREARRLCPAVIPVEANHRLYTPARSALRPTSFSARLAPTCRSRTGSWSSRDSTVLPELLHGQETRVWGDQDHRLYTPARSALRPTSFSARLSRDDHEPVRLLQVGANANC